MTQNRYDLVPYFSHPFQKTHPENLYTLARLFGVKTPAVETARVLELGCAGGGNIIPMAFNLPEGHFVGVDLSKKQLQFGWDMITALELTNITLEHISISDINADLGKFDYIICHGVYSWVPPDVQAKILEICSRNLTSTGIAYISYNCLPGWNFIKSIRDMMLYHAADFETPAEKAEQARSMLQFIINSQGRSDKAYTTYLKSEMDILSSHQDAYLLHDHLEDINEPIYFHEFMQRADRYHLAYLGDTDLFTMYPDNLDRDVATTIQKIPELIKAEQYMDFIRNRRFRSTVLCHAGTKINRELDVRDIEQFYVLTRA
ncbi:MAG: methyltransferase domain-containing protein, partial [Desulfobacterales bacterium]|nr:methyltransferase domain-containing protein [Desulfobacterales bacterium]